MLIPLLRFSYGSLGLCMDESGTSTGTTAGCLAGLLGAPGARCVARLRASRAVATAAKQGSGGELERSWHLWPRTQNHRGNRGDGRRSSRQFCRRAKWARGRLGGTEIVDRARRVPEEEDDGVEVAVERSGSRSSTERKRRSRWCFLTWRQGASGA